MTRKQQPPQNAHGARVVVARAKPPRRNLRKTPRRGAAASSEAVRGGLTPHGSNGRSAAEAERSESSPTGRDVCKRAGGFKEYAVSSEIT